MSFIKKWYTYQKERFPVLMYGIYIFAIVFSTYSFANWLSLYNNSLSNSLGLINPFEFKWDVVGIMFIVAFLQFLMVRIIYTLTSDENNVKLERVVEDKEATDNEKVASVKIINLFTKALEADIKGNKKTRKKKGN